MGRPLFSCNSSTSTADLDTIESSLRLCSLAAASSNTSNTNVAVHLNSEVPLPNNWEQVLNIQTGEIYYINRENGNKTSVDPRGGVPTASSFSSAESEAESTVDDASYDGSRSSCSSSSSTTSSSNNTNGGSCHESGGAYSAASSTLSVATTSSSSSAASSSSHPQQGVSGDVLVLVGCKVCLTLSMVPRTEAECPKCGDATLVRF